MFCFLGIFGKICLDMLTLTLENKYVFLYKLISI
jgi:hypothetical protein